MCFTLGVALLSRNELPQAEEAFRQAIHFNPRNPKAHLFLATVLLQRGENEKGRGKELFTEALAAADAALALQGDLAYAHLARGRALKHLGRPEEAVAALREAVLRGQEYAEVHQALGEALAEQGNLKEGLERLRDAVRLAKPGDGGPQQALRKWQAKAKKES